MVMFSYNHQNRDPTPTVIGKQSRALKFTLLFNSKKELKYECIMILAGEG